MSEAYNQFETTLALLDQSMNALLTGAQKSIFFLQTARVPQQEGWASAEDAQDAADVNKHYQLVRSVVFGAHGLTQLLHTLVAQEADPDEVAAQAENVAVAVQSAIAHCRWQAASAAAAQAESAEDAAG